MNMNSSASAQQFSDVLSKSFLYQIVTKSVRTDDGICALVLERNEEITEDWWYKITLEKHDHKQVYFK